MAAATAGVEGLAAAGGCGWESKTRKGTAREHREGAGERGGANAAETDQSDLHEKRRPVVAANSGKKAPAAAHGTGGDGRGEKRQRN